MTSDLGRLLGDDALGDALPRLRAATAPNGEILGWATVELDRAEAEVRTRVGGGRLPRVEPAPDERVLGARCRRLIVPGRPDVLLLEPSTEGRLAAALARYGEGFTVLYLLADAGAPERVRRAGFTLTAEGRGPFGPERLVLAGPRFGPFLVLAGLD